MLSPTLEPLEGGHREHDGEEYHCSKVTTAAFPNPICPLDLHYSLPFQLNCLRQRNSKLLGQVTSEFLSSYLSLSLLFSSCVTESKSSSRD